MQLQAGSEGGARQRILTVLRCFQTTVGMAFKTIDFDAGVKMAACAEMLRIFIAHDLFGRRRIMAIDATNQTVLSIAGAVYHGGIALVQQKFHVIPTHHLGGFNALGCMDRLWWLGNMNRAQRRTARICRLRQAHA